MKKQKRKAEKYTDKKQRSEKLNKLQILINSDPDYLKKLSESYEGLVEKASKEDRVLTIKFHDIEKKLLNFVANTIYKLLCIKANNITVPPYDIVKVIKLANDSTSPPFYNVAKFAARIIKADLPGLETIHISMPSCKLNNAGLAFMFASLEHNHYLRALIIENKLENLTANYAKDCVLKSDNYTFRKLELLSSFKSTIYYNENRKTLDKTCIKILSLVKLKMGFLELTDKDKLLLQHIAFMPVYAIRSKGEKENPSTEDTKLLDLYKEVRSDIPYLKPMMPMIPSDLVKKELTESLPLIKELINIIIQYVGLTLSNIYNHDNLKDFVNKYPDLFKVRQIIDDILDEFPENIADIIMEYQDILGELSYTSQGLITYTIN